MGLILHHIVSELDRVRHHLAIHRCRHYREHQAMCPCLNQEESTPLLAKRRFLKEVLVPSPRFTICIIIALIWYEIAIDVWATFSRILLFSVDKWQLSDNEWGPLIHIRLHRNPTKCPYLLTPISSLEPSPSMSVDDILGQSSRPHVQALSEKHQRPLIRSSNHLVLTNHAVRIETAVSIFGWVSIKYSCDASSAWAIGNPDRKQRHQPTAPMFHNKTWLAFVFCKTGRQTFQ